VTTGKLSPSGSASGQVLKSNGSAVVWGDDQQAGLTLPYAGTTSSGTAAFAVTNTAAGPALSGEAQTGAGVYGSHGGASGLAPTDYPGVWGDAAGALGVLGTSSSGFGVKGESSSSTGSGVVGYATRQNGVNHGVYGRSDSTSGVGVAGLAGAGSGSTRGIQGYSLSAQGIGVYGANALTGNAGELGTPDQGVYGENGSTSAKGSFGSHDYGVYGSQHGGTHSGYFNGDVQVNGTLTKSGGSFKIDHPLNPEHQYLSHSFVESPDMKNVYDGNVVTDDDGYATVTLPDWFEALNRDFRYQLTVISGGDQWALARVSRTIEDNRFVIQTSVPRIMVSWQVTGIRHDPWAEKHRIPVEEAKPDDLRGTYLNPELYGQPEELGEPWRAEQVAGKSPSHSSPE